MVLNGFRGLNTKLVNDGITYISHLASSNSTTNEVVKFTIPEDAKYLDFTLVLEQYGVLIDHKRIPIFMWNDTSVKQIMLSACADGIERYGLYIKSGSTIKVTDSTLRMYISASK